MGHKNIGGLFRNFDNMIYRERYEGMLDSLKRHGLNVNEEKILFDVEDSEDSYRIIEDLLKQKTGQGHFLLVMICWSYGVI